MLLTCADQYITKGHSFEWPFSFGVERLMALFKPGDRVTSTFNGLYSGLPGTIIMRSVIQQGDKDRYIIELDSGKRIVLWETQIDYYSYPQDKNN